MTGDPLVARGRTGGRIARAALALILLGAPVTARAAGVLSIEASLDRPRVAVGEEAQVTVVAEARGTSLPEFAFPSVPGLRVLRVADSQNFSWLNGKLSRASTSVFLVSGSAPGRYTIPPIRIASGGSRAQTEPIVLEVGGPGVPTVPGAPPGTSGAPRVWGDESLPELFVRLVVDRRQAYWNQQVTARFIFYSRERLEETPLWEVTDASGFWKQSLGEMKRGRVRIGNADYVAYEQDVAYFPTRTGTLKLGPGRIEARILRHRAARDRDDPWSIFAFPETRVETIPLQTESVSITVRPLPGDALPGFQGAVGRLAMDVKVDRFVARAGEPVTVTSILKGYGNLNTAGDPGITTSIPLRSFESPGAVTSRPVGFRVEGERRREKAFVPEVPGAFAIEPIRFTWFDPEEGRYRTQVSDSIRIRVAVGGDTTGIASAPREVPATARATTRGTRAPMDGSPPLAAAVLGAGSLAALASVATLGIVRRRAQRDPAHRRRESLRELERRLRAWSAPDAPPGAATRAAGAVLEALGLRFGADVEGRSREEALELARRSGADEGTLEAARALLERLDRAAFAPSSSGEGPSAIAAAHEFVVGLLGRLP